MPELPAYTACNLSVVAVVLALILLLVGDGRRPVVAVVEVVKWVDVEAMMALMEESAMAAMVEQVCGGFGNYASCTGVVC